MMTTITTPAALDHDARWASWKQDGVQRDARRVARMRQVIAALCLTAALWSILQF